MWITVKIVKWGKKVGGTVKSPKSQLLSIGKDYIDNINDSVIGMNKDNSLNRFMKKESTKHFPATGDATLSGVIVDCDIKTGLANKIESYVFGGQLKNT